MSLPVRSQITLRLGTLLEEILRSNGYFSDSGRRVVIANNAGSADEAPCAYLTPGNDQSAYDYGESMRETNYVITLYRDARDTAGTSFGEDDRQEWAIIDELLADVVKAVETYDADLRALVSAVTYTSGTPAYSEGGDLCGVQCKYAIRYRIAQGDPMTQPG